MSQLAHSEHLLEQLRWQRESNVLCDITVVVGDTLFRAHRNVLAAFSGFFSALPDRGHLVTTLNPEFVSEQALDTLLKYIYSGELHTDSEGSEAVLGAAVFLGMREAERHLKDKTDSQQETRIESTSPTPSHHCLPSPPSPEAFKPLFCVSGGGSVEREEEKEGEKGEEDERGDPEYTPPSPSPPTSPRRGARKRKGRKPKATPRNQTSPGNQTLPRNPTSPSHDDTQDDTTVPQPQRGRGRGRGKGRGRGRGRGGGMRRDLLLKKSDLQIVEENETDLSPSSLKPVKRQRRSSGERRGVKSGRGRGKLKENRSSDGEGDEGKAGLKNQQVKEKPVCAECNKEFSEISSLRRHMRIHKGVKPFQCLFCNRAFTQGNQLKTHLRIHTGEKPFACSQCDKGFAQKCQLVAHCRMYHGEEKPYTCEQCGLQFATSSNYKIHCRKHSGEKPYVCEQCGKGFAQASTLTYHMRSHTGEKPYQCDNCGMAFSVSSSLITHKRKHTGEATHECLVCQKAFITKRELNKHSHIHNGGDPAVKQRVTCELCGNTYAGLSSLKKHQERQHLVTVEVPEGALLHNIPIDHQGLISRDAPSPMYKEPDNPDHEEPDELEEPDNPDLEEPDNPDLEEPDNPDLEEPDNPDLEEPDNPEPKEPGNPEPEEPDNPEPTTPNLSPNPLSVLVEQLRTSSSSFSSPLSHCDPAYPVEDMEQIIIIRTLDNDPCPDP
uniref:Myoneurin n=1 Tax=Hucho hucho TaxID=62062 RepID=A0A4W5JZD0_9TELE